MNISIYPFICKENIVHSVKFMAHYQKGKQKQPWQNHWHWRGPPFKLGNPAVELFQWDFIIPPHPQKMPNGKICQNMFALWKIFFLFFLKSCAWRQRQVATSLFHHRCLMKSRYRRNDLEATHCQLCGFDVPVAITPRYFDRFSPWHLTVWLCHGVFWRRL